VKKLLYITILVLLPFHVRGMNTILQVVFQKGAKLITVNVSEGSSLFEAAVTLGKLIGMNEPAKLIAEVFEGNSEELLLFFKPWTQIDPALWKLIKLTRDENGNTKMSPSVVYRDLIINFKNPIIDINNPLLVHAPVYCQSQQ